MRVSKRSGIIGAVSLAAAATVGTFLATSSGIVNARTGTDYGTDLQAAINAAETGDTLEMNGTEAVCNCFDYKGLAIQGGTVKTPNASPAMYYPPKTPGAALRRMKFTTDPNWSQVHEIVKYGDYGGEVQDQFDEQPQGLTIEDTDVICGPSQNCQRGVSANGKNFSFIRSRVLNVHFIGVEAQGIISTNGSGPFRLIDAYIEGAGENAMWGGNDPAIIGLVADGIELTRVHLFKPLSWNPYDRANFVPLNGEAVVWGSVGGRGAWVKASDTRFVATHWGVKNLLEFKNAKNVVIDGLLAENCWGDAQIGFGVLFTVRNQNGKAPWSILENISMTNSIIRNVAGGFQLIGKDSPNESKQSSNLRIANVVVELAPPGGPMGPNGRLMQLQQYNNVTVENIEANPPHTFLNITGANADGSLQTNEGLVYRKSVVRHGEYGLFTDGAKPLTSYAPNAILTENWIYGTPAGAVKIAGNTYFGERPTTVPAGIGVDYAALQAAQPKPFPSPSPSATATVTISPTPILSPLPTPTTSTTSPDNTKGASIVDSSGKTWTLGPRRETLRDGTHIADGFGLVYKWLNGKVFVQGTDEKWYQFTGSSWMVVGVEPQPLPSPSPTVTVTPSPTPTATPTPTPRPSPSPSPSCPAVPLCSSGQIVGNPPQCLCRAGMRGDRCK